ADLVTLPTLVKEALGSERLIERVAKKYGKASDVLYLGRGINYPVALEGALKLKEISYIHAEGYPAGEMKHGPIALINEEMPVVVIIPHDAVFQKSLSNLKEVESRGGRIIVVTDAPSPELEDVAWEVLAVPRTNELLTPILLTVPLQLLAYHVAVYRGTDVDQPRNLAKRVTAEHINFMATHGRGLICLSLTEERCEQLGLSMMVKDNRAPLGTAFTVSIDARQGVARGISAIDRATTIRTAIRADAGPADIVTPGHVFPLRARRGGVLVRSGQTEGAVDLARLAGFAPAGVICEVMREDGAMARLPDLEA